MEEANHQSVLPCDGQDFFCECTRCFVEVEKKGSYKNQSCNDNVNRCAQHVATEEGFNLFIKNQAYDTGWEHTEHDAECESAPVCGLPWCSKGFGCQETSSHGEKIVPKEGEQRNGRAEMQRSIKNKGSFGPRKNPWHHGEVGRATDG